MARATAGRKTGDGRVHRTGRQGKVRTEHPAAGADGPGEATRTPPVADQMDSRHMSATVSGKKIRQLCVGSDYRQLHDILKNFRNFRKLSTLPL